MLAGDGAAAALGVRREADAVIAALPERERRRCSSTSAERRAAGDRRFGPPHRAPAAAAADDQQHADQNREDGDGSGDHVRAADHGVFQLSLTGPTVRLYALANNSTCQRL